MGRPPRIIVPGYPHHIVQRGHNKKAVFVETEDYEFYVSNLIEWKTNYNVAVYAYCLMTNHVHLIVSPRGKGDTVSFLMRRLSARQGRRTNKLEGRTGTIWSGRFKCSVIDSDNYLLACLRYVELNPVRGGLVTSPEKYRWSSYRQRQGLSDECWLDADPVTAEMGSTNTSRRLAYDRYLRQVPPSAELTLIRNAVNRNQLTGNHRFIGEIARRTGIRVARRRPGRPKK